MQEQIMREKLAALEAAISLRQEAPGQIWEVVANDSMIVRYCAAFRPFWEILIEELAHRNMPSGTPAQSIKSLIELKLISPQEGKLLLRMVKHKNFSRCGYSPEKGKIVADAAPGYFDLMSSIMTRLQK